MSAATRIDGAVSVNIWLPHHVGYVQPAETIETVNISTNNFDADLGMAGGAASTVVTKSGTNTVRGSAFEFHNREEFNANSLFNNAFGIEKSPLSHNIYGGTVGGPIVKNKLFYFGSWERFQDRRGRTDTYGVPTEKMRSGDFSEVAAAYSAFRLYNPFTGTGGTGREQFPNVAIPGGMLDPIARDVLPYYPLPNTTRDLNSNQLLDDYSVSRVVKVDRDNYDTKFTWQRSATHSVWGKFSMLDADVIDNFILGFEPGSLGHTRVYVGTVGHTWTFGRNMVLDGNFGVDIQNQEVTGPDYGTNIGLDLGIPGVNLPDDIRASGMPQFANGYTIGGTAIERLDYNTYERAHRRLGNVPKDVGINLKTLYFAPRLGAAYRLTENSVFRAGYGRTINPLPWSRPMRGSFPQDINFNRTADQFQWVGTLSDGIPPVPIPDISSGRVKLPQGVFMRSPNPDDVDRGIIQQWNVAYEYRLPWDVSTEVAYVGTRTDGGYADLNINYGVPGGGNASRQYFALAGTTAINDWAARTKSRYHALQVSLNRPFRNGLALKGAYTLSRAKNMADEDGWVGLTWNSPLMYDENYAVAGFDRTHIFQMGFVYEVPWMRDSTSLVGMLVKGWQVNGIFAAFSGTPYTITGTNTALNCQGCGSIFIDVSQTPNPTGSTGSGTEPYYPLEIFSQPTGASVAGFGNSGRNGFRRPPVWNLDLSLFKAFPDRPVPA